MAGSLLAMPVAAQEVEDQEPALQATEEGAAIMNRKKITSLFVTEGSGPALGLLHIHDCLRVGLG